MSGYWETVIKGPGKSALRQIHRMGASTSGSIAVLASVVTGVIAMATMGAIEVDRAYNARADMQKHLDATLLRLGRSEERYDPQKSGEKHFRSMVRESGIGLENLNVRFVFDAESGAVQGTATYTLPNILTGGMIPDMSFEVFAEALPKTRGDVEIALVLDTSGSMGWAIDGSLTASQGNRRIDYVRSATNTMLDVLQANDQIEPRISVIPYATSVDISDLYAAISDVARENMFDGVDSWTLDSLGIRNLTTDDLTYQDRSATRGAWAAERFQSRNGTGFRLSLDAPGGSNKLPLIAHAEPAQWCNPAYVGWYGSFCVGVAYIYHYNSFYLDGLTSQRGLKSLTSNLDDVRRYVDELEPSGGTAGHLGAIWGLYSLAPQWHGFFKHADGAPQPFGENEDGTKVLVMMTDGEFNNNHAQALGGTDDSYAYFQSACALARENGVRVFAIGLKVSERVERELSQCVGDSGKFFPVGTQSQLTDAFAQIGNSAGDLRISK